jgi:hypothetical protein
LVIDGFGMDDDPTETRATLRSRIFKRWLTPG